MSFKRPSKLVHQDIQVKVEPPQPAKPESSWNLLASSFSRRYYPCLGGVSGAVDGSCRVIVVGGGPAGLMAAGTAAGLGAVTLLIERMDSPGRKLRITGKGRCNLTNTASVSDFISHFGKNGRFLRQAFSRFFSGDLRAFFASLGVSTVVERGGRVFPDGVGAPELTEALVRWVSSSGAHIVTGERVTGIISEGGRITGVETRRGASRRMLTADAVVVATGGVSYPATGSTGDGYLFAESTGHKVVPASPALVPLLTAERWPGLLDGLNLTNVAVKAGSGGKIIGRGFGEVLFIDCGVSGPVPLTLSGAVVKALGKGDKVELCLDLKPGLDHRKLDNRIQRELASCGAGSMKAVLSSLLPSRLVPVISQLTGISQGRHCSRITSSERGLLRKTLKDLRLTVSGNRGFSEAIITAGGVGIRGIDPYTMGSRLVKGLFFAGEVLDIEGDTGGYNLQAAFSTGRLAGISAARLCDALGGNAV